MSAIEGLISIYTPISILYLCTYVEKDLTDITEERPIVHYRIIGWHAFSSYTESNFLTIWISVVILHFWKSKTWFPRYFLSHLVIRRPVTHSNLSHSWLVTFDPWYKNKSFIFISFLGKAHYTFSENIETYQAFCQLAFTEMYTIGFQPAAYTTYIWLEQLFSHLIFRYRKTHTHIKVAVPQELVIFIEHHRLSENSTFLLVKTSLPCKLCYVHGFMHSLIECENG